MTAYLTISIGTSPATARPLLASADPDIVQNTVRAILGKVEAIGAPDGALGGDGLSLIRGRRGK